MFRRQDHEKDLAIPLILGLIGAGIGFLVYCWLFLMMWKLGRNSPQYDRIHDIFSFIGYPSQLLLSILCKMHLMHPEDPVAVFAVIGAWYTFLGFLIGTMLYFLVAFILPKLLGNGSETNRVRTVRLLPSRWFVSIVMIISSLGGLIVSLAILFHKINPNNIYVEYSKGIYLFDCILAVILGIMGMLFGLNIMFHRSHRENKRGNGGTVVFLCIILAFISIGLAIYVMFPISKTHMCQAHLRDLWRCLSTEYPQINGGIYPNPSIWCDAFREIRPQDDEILLKCPGVPGSRCNYSINPKAFSNLSPNAVFLYDSKPGWNQSGGPEMLEPNNHGGKGCNIVFCDGRVTFVRTEEFKKLRWE